MDPSRSNGQWPPQPPSDGSSNRDERQPGYLPLAQNPYLGPLQQNQQTPAHPTASFYNQHHQQYHQHHQLYQHHQHYPLPQYHQYSSQPVYPYPSIPGYGMIMTNSSEQHNGQHNGQGQSGSAAPGQGTSGQVFNGGPSPQFMPPGSSSSHPDPNQMIGAGHAPQPPHPPTGPTTQYSLPPSTAPMNPSSGTGGIASTPEASYYDLTQNRSGQSSVVAPTPFSSLATPAEKSRYMGDWNYRNLVSRVEQETGKGNTSSEPFQPSAQQPPQPVANPQDRSGQNSVDAPSPYASLATNEERLRYSSDLNRRSKELLAQGWRVKKDKRVSGPSQPSAQQALATYEKRIRYKGDLNRRAQELIAQGHGVKKDKSSSEPFQPSAQQPPQPVGNPQYASLSNNFPVPTQSAPPAPPTQTLNANSKRRAQDAVDERPEKRQTASEPPTPPEPQAPPAPQPAAQQPLLLFASARPAAIPDRPGSPILAWDDEPDRLPGTDIARLRRNPPEWVVEPDPSQFMSKTWKRLSWSEAMEQIQQLLLEFTTGQGVFVKFWQFRQLCDAIEIFVARSDRRSLTREELQELIQVRYVDIIETNVMEGRDPDHEVYTLREWEAGNFAVEKMNKTVRLAFKERHRLAFTGGI